jgi:outer membrane protein assembly factor BamB
LDKDDEVLRLAAGAKTELRKLVVPTTDPVAAGTVPAEVGGVLTSAPRVFGTPVAKDLRKGEAVFAVARGVLYALDARTGDKLWAEQVQTEPRPADAPLRVRLQDGAKDLVLVPSLRGGVAALTARTTLTGEVEWHLPLPAPVLGEGVGNRTVVPVRTPSRWADSRVVVPPTSTTRPRPVIGHAPPGPRRPRASWRASTPRRGG